MSSIVKNVRQVEHGPRITLIRTLYVERPGEQTYQLQSSYYEMVKDEEGTFTKTVTLLPGQSFELPPDRVAAARLCMIQNTPPVRQVVPTEEEANADRDRYVKLTVGAKATPSDEYLPVCIIPPGDSLQLFVLSNMRYSLIAGPSSCKITIHLLG